MSDATTLSTNAALVAALPVLDPAVLAKIPTKLDQPESPPDPRNFWFEASGAPLPRKVDLRSSDSPLEDQLSIGACCPNAVAGAIEHILKYWGAYTAGVSDVSRLFLYWFGRAEDGLTGDSGTVVSSVLKVCVNMGVPPESAWPYDLNYWNEAPPQSATTLALMTKMTRFERINYELGESAYQTNIQSMKAAIADGCPVVVGFIAFEWLRHITGPMANHWQFQLNTDWTYQIGGHSVVAVGYDDDLGPNGSFIFKNSWGPNWGDNGYWAIGYEDFIGVSFEQWAVRGFNGLGMPRPSLTNLQTVSFSGQSSAYTWRPMANGYRISGTEGTFLATDLRYLQFSDLGFTMDQTGPGGQIYRLYKAALGRPSDPGGLGFHINNMKNGVSLQVIASGFLASGEFQAKYGTVDDTTFVTELYRNVLNREPDAGGLEFHVANLASGIGRYDVLIGFSESPEFITMNAAEVGAGIPFNYSL